MHFFHLFLQHIRSVTMCAMNFKRVNPAAKFGPAFFTFFTKVTEQHGLDVQQLL